MFREAFWNIVKFLAPCPSLDRILYNAPASQPPRLTCLLNSPWPHKGLLPNNHPHAQPGQDKPNPDLLHLQHNFTQIK